MCVHMYVLGGNGQNWEMRTEVNLYGVNMEYKGIF